MTLARLYFGVLQRLRSFSLTHQKKEIAVLVFHEICSQKEAKDKIHFTETETFLKFINENKNNIISLNSIQKNKSKKIGSFPKFVITFDDVYKSAIENAVPCLLNEGIPFILFVCPELINKEGYISDAQIVSLSANPLCEIGFHANHHIRTRQLAKAQFEKEIGCEDFEMRFGIKCHYFAFPYGSYYACKRKRIQALLSKRYLCAFSTVFGFANGKSILNHGMFLPRIVFSEAAKSKILKSFSDNLEAKTPNSNDIEG